MRNNIHDNCKIVKENNFNTGLVDGKFPASGSFENVSDYTHFAFAIFLGTLDSALTAQVQQDTSATQTGSIKAITGAVATLAATDDDKWATIEVETAKLDIQNSFHFVTLDITGAAGGNDYAAIVFMAWNARHAPVTQVANYDQAIEIMG